MKDFLQDKEFLKNLDKENLKTRYVKILVLEDVIKDNLVISETVSHSIEGRVTGGSISIDGSSSVRRTGNISFIPEEKENDLTNISNLLSMNKKIRILIGVENNIDKRYDKIIWFPQGTFIIVQPSLSHSQTGTTINLQIKDEMCLLNGEMGGNLPASITFDSYDQVLGSEEVANLPDNPVDYKVYIWNGGYYIWNQKTGYSPSNINMIGKVIKRPNRIYDIIQTLVCNFGNIPISKIIINDIDLELRASYRNISTDTLYFDPINARYYSNLTELERSGVNKDECYTFDYGEDCGYMWTDFTYPGSLVSGINENICSILDKIKNTLGNFEYFFDLDGNFVFQEVKNYLNNTYLPIEKKTIGESKDKYISNTSNILNGDILKSGYKDYEVDFSNNLPSIYNFEENNNLFISTANTPSFTNIKNDFHIWGKNQGGLAIHYHIAFKNKPEKPYASRKVVFKTEDEDGKIRLALPTDLEEDIIDYVPNDWRAELYLRGLEKIAVQQRPDIYEQEILDFFDMIYNMRDKTYKVDITDRPNRLNYWIDYIEPIGKMSDISIDNIGPKIYSYQKDNIKRLYDMDIPDYNIIGISQPKEEKERLEKMSIERGNKISHVNTKIFNSLALGTIGYTAKEVARELIYQYTDFNSAINITGIPIYYIEPNRRITISDRAAGIFGDYIIKSINLPLDGKGTMSITATKALERI